MQYFNRWLRRGTWALLDQGFSSISNFALNLLLARWLTPQGYGAFTLAYTFFWLFGSFYNALVIEPALVFGSGKYSGSLKSYLGALLFGQLACALVGSLLFVMAAIGFGIAGSSILVAPFLSLAINSPLMLFLWLMRQACYIQIGPQWAAVASIGYLFLVVAEALFLSTHQLLSAAMAFGLMGANSLVLGLWLTVQLQVTAPFRVPKALVWQLIIDHWGFGRWTTATRIFMRVPESIYNLALTVWGGLEATAALRALINLTMPVVQTSTAISSLLVPKLVKVTNRHQFNRNLGFALIGFLGFAFIYWAFISLFSLSLIVGLYGAKYREYAGLLWLVGLMPLFSGIVALLGSALKALEQPKKIFLTFSASTPITLVLTLGLIFAFNVAGAIFGLLITSVLTAGILAWLLATYPRSDQPQQDPKIPTSDI